MQKLTRKHLIKLKKIPPKKMIGTYIVSIVIFVLILGISVYGSVVGQQNLISRYVFIAVAALSLILIGVTIVLKMRRSKKLSSDESREMKEMQKYN